MLIKALTVIEADAALLTFPRTNQSTGHLKPAPSRPKASNFSLLELFAGVWPIAREGWKCQRVDALGGLLCG